MSAVPLGLSNYVRRLGGSAPVVLINMLVEKDPTNLVDGYVRIQRPAITRYSHVNGDVIKAMFCQPGTFNGDILIASTSSLFRVDTHGNPSRVGTISAPSIVRMCASGTEALVATGTTCYRTDGSFVRPINMPNNVGVQDVEFINGYFILVQSSSQRFYWIAPGQTDPDPLSFASAENNPDNIIAVKHIGDELWFFGAGNSTEVWQPTGDANLPFQRVEGRLYDKGCANRDTLVKLDNTLFWVGNDMVVYRGEQVPTRISDNSIEEVLFGADRTQVRAWGFVYQGHELYVLTIGTAGTFVYDISVGAWSSFASYGQTSWRAHLGVTNRLGQIIAGSSDSPELWILDPHSSNDDKKPMVREVMGGVAVIGAATPCSSFSIYVATGHANPNAPGNNPVMEMRFSDDGGNIWSNWRQMPLGTVGQYGREIAATRLGMMRAPGRLFHLRMSEDCLWRVTYARVNEWLAC